MLYFLDELLFLSQSRAASNQFNRGRPASSNAIVGRHRLATTSACTPSTTWMISNDDSIRRVQPMKFRHNSLSFAARIVTLDTLRAHRMRSNPTSVKVG